MWEECKVQESRSSPRRRQTQPAADGSSATTFHWFPNRRSQSNFNYPPPTIEAVNLCCVNMRPWLFCLSLGPFRIAKSVRGSVTKPLWSCLCEAAWRLGGKAGEFTLQPRSTAPPAAGKHSHPIIPLTPRLFSEHGRPPTGCLLLLPSVQLPLNMSSDCEPCRWCPRVFLSSAHFFCE